MEILTHKLGVVKKALVPLASSVSLYQESKNYPKERFEEYRDSLIQGFEYCNDLLW